MKMIVKHKAGNKFNERGGQALLLTVLTLGGAMLGATAIAGLLMSYQIRSTGDAVNSQKAIFATDAGFEWSLYDYFCGAATASSSPLKAQCINPDGEEPVAKFSNGAAVSVACYDANDAPASCSSASAAYAVSRGSSMGSNRAVLFDFGSATSSPHQ